MTARMVLRAAAITLKQHRFEVASGVLACLLVTALAVWVNVQLLGLGVTPDCYRAWRIGTPTDACAELVDRFARLDGEYGSLVFAAMAVLPLIVGLLGGVTIVGGEIEARTAQTAWALAGSRAAWLGRQLWPVLLILGAGIGLAAIAVSNLEATRAALGTYPFHNFALYGPLVVLRWLAAFGVGLAIGAVVGRTLPALIVAAVLVGVLLTSTLALRAWWMNQQPQIVFTDAQMQAVDFDGVPTTQGWIAPDGTLFLEEDAAALAPPEADDYYTWLIDAGYTVVTVGIDGVVARGYEVVEGFVTLLVAFGAVAAA